MAYPMMKPTFNSFSYYCRTFSITLAEAGTIEPGVSAPQQPQHPRQLSAAAEADRTEGNIAFFDKDYLQATQRYTRALCLAPWSASLFASRWVGTDGVGGKASALHC